MPTPRDAYHALNQARARHADDEAMWRQAIDEVTETYEHFLTVNPIDAAILTLATTLNLQEGDNQ